MSAPRAVVGPLLVALLAAGSATDCGDDGHEVAAPADVFALVDRPPGQVRSLDLSAGPTTVRLRRTAGVWQAGAGTSPVAASLLQESEDALLPLQAYRRLGHAPEAGEVGLGQPAFVLRVGGTVVSVGGPNFLGAGFYASRQGDSHIYLLSRGTVDILRSLAEGRRVVSPRPEKETKFFDELAKNPEEELPPWLQQALEEEGP